MDYEPMLDEKWTRINFLAAAEDDYQTRNLPIGHGVWESSAHFFIEQFRLTLVPAVSLTRAFH